MSSFFDYPRILMILTGIWVADVLNPKLLKLLKCYSTFWQAQFVVFDVIFFTGLLIADNQVLDDNLQYFPPLVGMLLKVFYCQTEKLKDLLASSRIIEKQLLKDQDPKVRKIVRAEVKYSRKLFYMFMGLYGFTLFQSLLFGWFLMTKVNSVLFSAVWYPFDYKKHIKVSGFHQLLFITHATIMYSSFDTFFGSIIIFVTTRVKVLSYKMKYFQNIAEKSPIPVHELLKNLIREHQDIIRYVDKVNGCLRWCFFVDFTMKSYSFSQFLFALIKSIDKRNLETIFSICKILAVITENWYINYHGNELMITSRDMANSIFANNWYKLDIKTQKSFLLMMLRSQRALEIRIGNMYCLSNNLFIKILKGGYTFILFYNV